MGLFQIVIILVCAALGFGIVNNLLGATPRTGERGDSETKEPDRLD